MDIDLLSKMVRELILDNDKVALPGLGFFAAEIVPSTFSDKGYTINPPYRKLYFRQDSGRDGLLARLYAESNGTGTDVAEHIIEDFIRGMREVLDKEKVIVFPGLGRLRATKENNYFFVPDEDMDIFPEGAGLEPVSLKTHKIQALSALGQEGSTAAGKSPEEVSPEEASAEEAFSEEISREDVSFEASSEDAFKEQDPASALELTPASEQTPAQEPAIESALEQDSTPDPYSGPEDEAGRHPEECETENEERKPDDVLEDAERAENAGKTAQETHRKGIPVWLKASLVTLAVLILLAVIALGAFVLMADFCPDFINSILYSPEELEILNY